MVYKQCNFCLCFQYLSFPFFSFSYCIGFQYIIIAVFVGILSCSWFFKKDFIYLFLERGEGKEKERERNINVWLPLECPLLGTRPATQACALTGNRFSDPSVPRLALSPLSHTSQASCSWFWRRCLHVCCGFLIDKLYQVKDIYFYS